MVTATELSWSALVIDDDPAIRQSIRLCLEAENARVQHVGTPAGALDALDRSRFDVVVLDLWLGSESGLTVLPEILRRQPGAGVIVVTAFATYESAVEAMKLGAVDYLPKPFTPEQVRTAARRVVTAGVLKRQLTELQDRLEESESESSFETCSPAYATFLQTVARAAASDAGVLLRGASGTGKTVLARWVRRHSRRPDGPFVTVHCPLLSNELMSSVLFGHKKGAFTGAVTDTVGKVEEAEGGTLFLDEVGDLNADAQARLLRFLNDRTYERVGEARERRADVRLIAATNRALEADVRDGRFREDLFFRLNVITLTAPALRDRREDVLPMARHYLNFFERRQGRNLAFSPACEAAIAAHPWPGNLRELRNGVERAVILCPAAVIEAADLGLAPARGPGLELGADVSLEEIEREHIARVVARAGSFEAAARVLGIDVTTLQRKRKRYGVS
ncbi:chemotaxis protein : Two component, sigma54 specific, transcriptional regulator, Fis family OS=Isosphaera pallida (strain ATCC 43644 / DSM 9630 / IS1B) GN=Isop_2814 PE=4 SV=1: Response_reg: Sigma54_activat: HTH_8 [Gemmata massiliana]|uniref:Response regulatory domain-containing protein n=1 Tax=Gemmata massiliana TaxID=1210884 RepID=A0A6P2DLV1_9BACT|nr:sigma-54 dependent transcriptional regulator [Gemmata massiliana]VTS01834.1 chemotaxis protein : Two component, sigma54 specific, transcriptional regulator, Fis family OS=Isosphaera pallida (strain ATCC 43644 / DSM 9630 / IS1B) GN=Isop_2814 PE=4 SV=1: Response_reg: Sigma54_activat: HTH_8 [Gemmata massiliana]